MYRIINKKKKYATRIADGIGYFAFCLFGGAKKRQVDIIPEKITKILIIRTAYVGDVMMTVPILKPLKTYFKNAHICFLTSASGAELLKGNPYVDSIKIYNPFWFYTGKIRDYCAFIRGFRTLQFDLLIEARGDIRDLLLLAGPLKSTHKVSYEVGGGGFLLTQTVPHPKVNHRIHYHLDIARFLGAECDYTHIEWGVYFSDKEKKDLDAWIGKLGVTGDYWCAHPGSRIPLKQWSVEKYAESFDRICSFLKLPLILLGDADDMQLVTAIQKKMSADPYVLCGKTSLRQLAGILSKTSLFVCNDSAPMHIAAAMKAPVVAIFGPSKSAQTGPYTDKSSLVEKDFSCRETCDESTCTNRHYHACMEAIMVDDVMDAVKKLVFKPYR